MCASPLWHINAELPKDIRSIADVKAGLHTNDIPKRAQKQVPSVDIMTLNRQLFYDCENSKGMGKERPRKGIEHETFADTREKCECPSGNQTGSPQQTQLML